MNRREFLRAAMAGGLVTQWACDQDVGLRLPARTSSGFDAAGLTRLARFAHITDTHLTDTLSPARFCGGQIVTRSAWRPWEASSGQIVDGIIRAINRIHASGRTVDFVLHTGDGCDNAQSNELAWLLAILDGRPVNPLSGPDDRTADAKPIVTLDPYAAFLPQGLYRQGVHGPMGSIPWYGLIGNHDTSCIGVLPIFNQPGGGRTAPVPLQPRPGIVLPVVFDPEASLAYGNVTPAEPGPPPLFQTPRYLQPNPDRRFFTKTDFKARFFDTESGPAGHGMSDPSGPTWFSISPAAGLRIIGLDSSDPTLTLPNTIYVDGAMSAAQVDFLRAELDAARARDELVVVATHHPSSHLQYVLTSVIGPDAFRAMLAEYTNVVAHLCGHEHVNRVIDRGSYLEILTCSTIDLPQEGRLLEIYRDSQTGEAAIAYEMFSHDDDSLPELGNDPLRGLRLAARATAEADAGTSAGVARHKLFAGEENLNFKSQVNCGLWRRRA